RRRCAGNRRLDVGDERSHDRGTENEVVAHGRHLDPERDTATGITAAGGGPSDQQQPLHRDGETIWKEHDMKGLVLAIGTIVAALSLSYGLGIASASSSSTGTGAKVAVANSNLGRILVDSHGRTLYLFAKDKNGKSTCYGLCAGYWPALTTKGKPKAITGAPTPLPAT